jgi:cell division GTPase FtsZ
MRVGSEGWSRVGAVTVGEESEARQGQARVGKGFFFGKKKQKTFLIWGMGGGSGTGQADILLRVAYENL